MNILAQIGKLIGLVKCMIITRKVYQVALLFECE